MTLLLGDVFIHPTAVVDPTAKLGPNVSIGRNCVIRAGARVRESIVLDGADLRVCRANNCYFSRAKYHLFIPSQLRFWIAYRLKDKSNLFQ